MIKVRSEYYIMSIWGIYALYLLVFGNLLLFPKDSFELIVPVALQLVLFMAIKKLFKGKYVGIISLTTLISCVLVILWHFSLNHDISRKMIIMLFSVLPLLSAVVIFFDSKISKVVPISVGKNFGVSFLLTFLNFIIAVFIFYFFHYWI